MTPQDIGRIVYAVACAARRDSLSEKEILKTVVAATLLATDPLDRIGTMKISITRRDKIEALDVDVGHADKEKLRQGG